MLKTTFHIFPPSKYSLLFNCFSSNDTEAIVFSPSHRLMVAQFFSCFHNNTCCFELLFYNSCVLFTFEIY